MVIFFGRQPEHGWQFQQSRFQRKLLVFQSVLRYERVEPEPELGQRHGQPEQQQ